ncbi:hypothetical protein RHMOL_Rhmol01G0319400 [Rhododendron molle]|uniref:Uncharacterized protein n=1 Tax=Rhododendron molle TaxID=49168 RepID=A0ACC0Q7F4_RHOML|nr:hypothetical protein RHMOL_Rhmol01G0319400 [Rhododendron molle]
MNRDNRSSDGVSFRVWRASLNRWRVASVAESNAVANGFSGRSMESVSGSLPKVSPHMLSKVRRSNKSCKLTGVFSKDAFSKMGQRRVLMVRLTHRAMACLRVRVVNSSAAVLRWISHVSPSLLKMP